MSKISGKQKRWSDEDRFAFATSRLRAQTMPNKRAKSSKNACRRWEKD